MTLSVTAVDDGYIVEFPYNAALVEAVKALPQRKFQDLGGKKFWWVGAKSTPQLGAMLDRVQAPVSILPEVRQRLTDAAAAIKATVAASRAASADVDLPVPNGLAYLPYQRAGIHFTRGRKNTLIGDDMGLGKTIQGIGASNCRPEARSILIIVPASLRLNWVKEWRKWDTKGLSIAYVEGLSSEFPTTDVVVINYNLLLWSLEDSGVIYGKHLAAIHARKWDMVIVDEAHYLKNPKTQRTAAVYGKWDRKPEKRVAPIEAEVKIALTGTPIPNRPIEAYPTLKWLDEDTFGNWGRFAMRYCGGHRNGYGWDVKGASNLQELQELMRSTVMIRRLKADVLKELPPKRRQIIELEGHEDLVRREREAFQKLEARVMGARVAAEIAKASEDDDEYKAAVDRLTEALKVAFTDIAKLRHDTAVAKIPDVIEHIRDSLEHGKVVVFAHHKDVIRAILDEFDGAVSITGDTPLLARQAAVEEFQKNPECVLFVGNIMAAGVGHTLTASRHVIFAELDWVPGNITQAEDRCHRIGQTDHVLVQHLVLNDSLDARMAKRLVQKQEVIDKALDVQGEIDTTPILAFVETAATENTRRKEIVEAAADITQAQIKAVHLGLQMLAGKCDGARALDGAGFSAVDVRIGHEFAERSFLTPRQAVLGQKFIRKYRRQLPDFILIDSGVQS